MCGLRSHAKFKTILFLSKLLYILLFQEVNITGIVKDLRLSIGTPKGTATVLSNGMPRYITEIPCPKAVLVFQIQLTFSNTKGTLLVFIS